MLDMRKVLTAKPKPHEGVELTKLLTPWGEKAGRASRAASSMAACTV